jgi:hypothetical protein
MKDRSRLYVETSIISYLTGQPSRDIVTAARQQLTRDWWQTKRGRFELYISEYVLTEAASGDEQAAARRLSVLEGIPELELGGETARLAESFLAQGALPQKAAIDALHIAAAVSSGMDFLLTWNFKHLANAALRSLIDRICRSQGYEPCVICTPEELSEE